MDNIQPIPFPFQCQEEILPESYAAALRRLADQVEKTEARRREAAEADEMLALTRPPGMFAVDRRMCTPREFCRDNPWITEPRMRQVLRSVAIIDMLRTGAVARLGRFYYIDADRFTTYREEVKS